MSRNIRIVYPGAYYHIYNCGVGDQNIFYCDQDKDHFEILIGDLCTKFDVQIHAYCLLDNQFHMTIQTPTPNVSRAIHYLESAYVNRMNSELDREGPFFQSRFRAIVVDSKEYLSHLTRYIHLLPKNSGIVDSPARYLWSSYSAYVGLVQKPFWLETSAVLAQFNKDISLYRAFVENDQRVKLDNFFAQKTVPAFLGNEAFRMNLEEMVKAYPQKKRESLLSCIKARYTFVQIMKVVMDTFNVDQQRLLQVQNKKHNIPRLIFIYLCKKYSDLGNRAIADFLQLKSEAAISLATRRLEDLMQHNVQVQLFMEMSEQKLLVMSPRNMQELLETCE